MAGYRRGLSSQENIVHLLSLIEPSRQDQRSTLAVYFDVTKPNNNVNIAVVLEKITAIAITGKNQSSLQSILTNRTLQVRLGASLSTYRKCAQCLPTDKLYLINTFQNCSGQITDISPRVHSPHQYIIVCRWPFAFMFRQIEIIVFETPHKQPLRGQAMIYTIVV